MQVKTDLPNQRFDIPSANLSRALRENCPSLNSIRDCCRSRMCVLLEADHLNLLKSTSHLAHYDIPMKQLTTNICDALLAHAPTLERVRIFCSKASEEDLSNVGRILSSGLKLKSFIFDGSPRPEDVLRIFEQPWNCPSLKEIDMTGFALYDENKLKRRLSEALYERLEQEEKNGRHADLKILSGGTSDGFGEASEFGQTNSGVAESRVSISRWTRDLAYHGPRTLRFTRA